MPQRIIERKPAFGMVFLVKYSFDNKTWSQFWSEYAHEHGNLVTFYGCKTKMTLTNPFTGACITYASTLPDMPIDGNNMRTLGLTVRRPPWFDMDEDEAKASCEQRTSVLNFPDLCPELSFAG